MAVTDPVPLVTSDVLQRRYPELCMDVDPVTLDEVVVEATANIEDRTGRRLAPFTNLIYEDQLFGIRSDQYGGNADLPLDVAGALGMSYANALGAGNLVREFWLDEFAPMYPELWTYSVSSMSLHLTFGNTLPVDIPSGGLIMGPEVTTGHCLVPGTRVLNGALEWVPIESLQIGDELVGIDETTNNGQRQYHPSVIEGTQRFDLPCYDVEFDDGSIITCSEDHRWFVKIDGQFFWRRTDQLVTPDGPRWHPHCQASQVVRPFATWEHDTSNDAGYLAAAFDGEGSLMTRDVRLSFCQRQNPMLARVVEALRDRGFVFSNSINHRPQPENFTRSEDIHNLVLGGGRDEVVRFLGMIRPDRLLPKFEIEGLGYFRAKAFAVPVRITPVGVKEVVALQTSTRTYFAEGFVAHNCWLRMGTFAPEGSRVKVVYSGGYTVAIPASLRRACLFQAAKFLVLEAEPQSRKGMDIASLDEQIDMLLAPWVRG